MASFIQSPGFEPKNGVLRNLSSDEWEKLRPHLVPEELTLRAVLQEIGQPVESVYFLERGMVSLVIPLRSGAEIEVGTIGVPGIVNALAVSDYLPPATRTIVQVGGSALKMGLRQFRESAISIPSLGLANSRQVTLLHAIAAQSAACNSQHEVSERMARWLLHVSDETATTEFGLTQEFMADMLGVRRPTVSTAAMTLQMDGAITYRRGRISIVDRQQLQSAACECYAAVRDLPGPASAMLV